MNDYLILRIVLSFIVAFGVVFVSIPSIVSCALKKNLCDIPGKRKSHHVPIPNLGGVAIFAGITIASGVFVDIDSLQTISLIKVFTAMVLIFLAGLKDDIMIITPVRKLYFELLAAVIITIFANIRLTNLHGILGIYEVNYITSIVLSVFTIIVIINSLNLVDGVDGLAAGISSLIIFIWGAWFYQVGEYNYCRVSATILGALLPFFYFNVFGKRNKVFMGDSGALVLGLFISVFAIKYNELNINDTNRYAMSFSPAFSIGLLIIPLFDTLRVFIIRIWHRQSPFHADKNHLHHNLLRFGHSHLKVTGILLLVNIIVVIIVYMLQGMDIFTLILVPISIMVIFSVLIKELLQSRKHRLKASIYAHLRLTYPQKKKGTSYLWKIVGSQAVITSDQDSLKEHTEQL